MMIEIRNPRNATEFKERDELLFSTMRESGDDIPISADYPIALSKNHPQFSYCLYLNNQLIAHMNLLPRKLISASREISVGFIGNVATTPEFQGKGFGHQLMDFVEKKAAELQLNALILWNDIPEFYSKLGFKPFGKELRFTFDAKLGIHKIKLERVNACDFNSLARLRFDGEYVVQRSSAEWKQLSSIPRTQMLVERVGNEIKSYFVFGRGTDMQHVIHEWGTTKIESLLSAISLVGESENFSEIMLMAPNWLPSTMNAELEKYAKSHSIESMCWLKRLGELDPELESKLYIWGLDSI